MRLTTKQRLFADEYIKSGNATQSAIKAGYATKAAYRTGSENLRKPQIKAYIDAKMAEIESRKIADAKEAMQAITAIARGETTETQAQINPLTGEWEKTEVPADLKIRLTAWREILKRYPLSDELTKAQLRKTSAEARVAEARAKSYESGGQDVTEAVGAFIDLLKEGVDQNHEDQSKQSSDS
ncbi:terminase small subunit [Limosilactobacillus pontis]|uniref:terminase small subunit n=1 Tax=Limosilactobacillus pontis TaxID=35787 RepID=UPI0025A402BB|nr:terminase small subunit [Limosilactobacillus pontis]MDM8331526.1 terminase small subunit [Limosilactobacillus pontis]